MNNRPLFIPVVLGTVRKGRASENVAKFVFEQVKRREGIETEFVDIGPMVPRRKVHTCPECGRSELRQAE